MCFIKNYANEIGYYGFSEALGSLAIGIFYFYVCVVISTNNDRKPTVTFNLEPDTILLNASNFEENSTAEITTAEKLTDFNNTFVNFIPIQHVLEYNNRTTNNTKPSKSNVDQFLENYHNLFKDLLYKNKDAANETKNVYVNNVPLKNFTVKSKVVKIRQKREAQFIFGNKDEVCDLKTQLLKHAMLVFSFANSLMGMFMFTKSCKLCTFSTKPTGEEIEQPTTTSRIVVQQKPNETHQNAQSNCANQCKAFVLLLITLVTPIVMTSCLYFFYNVENNNVANMSQIEDIFDMPKFTGDINEILNQLHMNASENKNNSDVNDVIKNIYSIVEDANKNLSSSNKRGNVNTPVMTDIVNHLNANNDKNHGQCDFNTTPLKIHTFVLFIVGYFAVITYVLTQIAKSDKLNARNRYLKPCVYFYVVMWSPSIFELIARTYFQQFAPNAVSQVVLAIGILQKVVSNVVSVKNSKESVKMRKFVGPE